MQPTYALIDAVFDRRMAPQGDLAWALAEAQALKHRLTVGLRWHSADPAGWVNDEKRTDVG